MRQFTSAIVAFAIAFSVMEDQAAALATSAQPLLLAASIMCPRVAQPTCPKYYAPACTQWGRGVAMKCCAQMSCVPQPR